MGFFAVYRILDTFAYLSPKDQALRCAREVETERAVIAFALTDQCTGAP